MGCKNNNPPSPQIQTPLEMLVQRYLSEKIPDKRQPGSPLATARESHEYYLSSLKDLTDYICGEPNDNKAPEGGPYKFNGHQWNLKFSSRTHVVDDMFKLLKDIDKETFEDFEQLREYVSKKRIPYFGDTAVYDFSLRYGWNHNPRIIPEKYVYIHSKPMKSAKHLYKLGYLPELAIRMEREKYGVIAHPEMTTADIEHFLCWYHDEIMNLK